MYDVLVIGSGPAGVSAAIYAKRANMNTVIVSMNEGNLAKADLIENYYGFPEPISGRELVDNGVKQAQNIGVEFKKEQVMGIQFMGDYLVETSENQYMAKSVIIATGLSRNVPNIKGIKEFDGRGISYCAVCDGFFYRGKKVVVLGNSDYAIHEATYLKQLAGELVILTNGKTMENKEGFEVNEKKIKEIVGDKKAEKIIFEDDSEITFDGIFVAMGVAGSFEFARKMGAALDGARLIVNEKMETNLPGLYAAGDNIGGLLQVAKAVYDGAVAGSEAAKYVRSKK